MRPVLTLAGLLLCAFASPPGIDSWNGGPKTPDFHHLTVDCRTVVHTHGRNGVWGRWETASPEQVRHFLERWQNSSLSLLRMGHSSLLQLVMMAWYSRKESWAHCGYPGPPTV